MVDFIIGWLILAVVLLGAVALLARPHRPPNLSSWQAGKAARREAAYRDWRQHPAPDKRARRGWLTILRRVFRPSSRA